MIVLVGFMGAGKTSVGALLADRLGRPFIDTDAEIERSAGVSIADLFTQRGERMFRELERETVNAALSRSDAVVSLGGGALGDPATRAALEWADVVLLDVSFPEALRRIGDGADRPMVHGSDVKALYEERRANYISAARVTVSTDGRAVEDIVDELAERFGGSSSQARVRVQTDPSYDVIIGRGLIDRFKDLVPVPDDATKAALITHPDLRSFSEAVAGSLSGLETTVHEVPAGESSKQLAVAADLYDTLAQARLRRSDLVIGVGGGVIGDLAGFVASTYLRGVAVAHVATSLLAQVDAAIGGKTAVNLAAGKNLVGTFHQPIAVLCDIKTLESLPDEEFRSGLAEVVKAGFIADPGLIELFETRSDAIAVRDETLLRTVILRAVGVKASVVAADEREGGRRAILNYGHTIGHALETARRLRHGEAISLGMMAAAHLAHELGLIDEEVVRKHGRILSRCGLPVNASVALEEIEPLVMQDKKARATPRFVLLRAIGIPVIDVEAPRDVLEKALKRLEG